MKVLLNNMITDLPSDLTTVEQLLIHKNIKREGTAVAINDMIVKKADWNRTILHELDRVTIISAAFGG